MLVREYLHAEGITKEQLAELIGHKSTASVTKKMEVEMPKRWAKLLDSESLPAVDEDESERFAHEQPPEFRDDDKNAPEMPEGATPVFGPQKIKLSTVEGYIQKIYGGAAVIARGRGDDIAADVIEQYTPEFSEAWIDYIKSDPRLLEYLEKLMIGTPLGNLIGVHAIAIGSYTFARITARQIAAAYAEERASVNGADNSATPDFMG